MLFTPRIILHPDARPKISDAALGDHALKAIVPKIWMERIGATGIWNRSDSVLLCGSRDLLLCHVRAVRNCAARGPARSDPYTQTGRNVHYDGAPSAQAAGCQAAISHSDISSWQQRRQLVRWLGGNRTPQIFHSGWNSHIPCRKDQGGFRL